IPNIAQESHEFGEADALMLEVEAFLEVVRTRGRPAVDGEAGRDAVQAAQLITDSLNAHRRMLEQAGLI
ncbi:MAG TPA: gfo/Idh/MocA family oxidoreductase, partial [Alphaproteobacteria bacterium]|nr:gfo/Idh/MocA family oxidoreductase [Alphaproteobacteria bacterium]